MQIHCFGCSIVLYCTCPLHAALNCPCFTLCSTIFRCLQVPDDKGEPTAPTTGPTAPAPDSNQGGPDHTNNDNQPGDAHVSVVIASKTSKASHAPRGPSNQEAGRQEQITSRMTQQTESTAPYPTELPAGPSGGSSMQGSNSNTSQPVTATTITPQITQSTGKSAGSGRGSGSVVSRGRGSKQGSFGSHSVGRMSHGALSSLHESISGLSLDEELVYQVRRMACPCTLELSGLCVQVRTLCKCVSTLCIRWVC